ncbi:MAG: DNA polymerase Y family protein, partial [Myxococcaceae bacterium]|nr:DNA polymerase Y family protein [Myxococcaceae bacterium]
ALAAVRLLGRRRAVESVSGPERLQGEWWSTSPYARDYYRVRLQQVGELWLYRDAQQGGFFVQGLFD